MAYIYGLVDSLQGKDQVGDGECVTLVKQYAHLGVTGTRKQGRKVFGDKSIPGGQQSQLLLMVNTQLVTLCINMRLSILNRILTIFMLWISGKRRKKSRPAHFLVKVGYVVMAHIRMPVTMPKLFILLSRKYIL